MEIFGFESYILWFIAAIILIGSELIAGFGVLFLFLLGLSALCVGFLTYSNHIDPHNLIAQLIIFLTLFIIFFILLWKPIKKIINQNANNKYQNIVGQKGEVISSAITKKKRGKIRWSGTEVNARLHKDCTENSIDIGENVEIVEIKDNTFIVKTIK